MATSEDFAVLLLVFPVFRFTASSFDLNTSTGDLDLLLLFSSLTAAVFSSSYDLMFSCRWAAAFSVLQFISADVKGLRLFLVFGLMICELLVSRTSVFFLEFLLLEGFSSSDWDSSAGLVFFGLVVCTWAVVFRLWLCFFFDFSNIDLES